MSSARAPGLENKKSSGPSGFSGRRRKGKEGEAERHRKKAGKRERENDREREGASALLNTQDSVLIVLSH